MKDFSKVKRYSQESYQDNDGEYHQTWREVSYGDWVAHKDYLELLNSKTPERSASFKDFTKLVKKKIKELEKQCDDVFLKKDKINYGWAVHKREQASLLWESLELMKNEIGFEYWSE